MIKIKPTKDQQNNAVLFISQTFDQYKKIMQPYQDRLLDIFTELSTFNEKKLNDWSTSFKVNKAHEISNKITPRIISKNPKRLVSYKPDFVAKGIMENRELPQEASAAIEALLTNIFNKGNLDETLRIRAKGMVNYGHSFAKIKRKYELGRRVNNVDKTKPIMDEEGNQIGEEKIDKEIEEYVTDSYSTIDVSSWADLYYDLRYKLFDDMPAIIEVMSGVRLGDLKRNKDYLNLDLLEDICNLSTSDFNSYKTQVYNILGINVDSNEGVDKNNLKMNFYYGLYDLDGEERLYKIGTVNKMVVVCFEEISQIPFVQIRCFEDTESNMAVGFIEPILGLQKELNFKKNSASEYINQSLNRSWIWSAYSGINPKKLISKANNIIATTKTVTEAQNNLVELNHREINPSYFNEQNDFERQIQGLSFTVDTSNPNNQQALTNTATGARIKFYESNVVIDDVRKHFEQGLVKVAYKLLQDIIENSDENITIKKLDDTGFWNINKEAIKDAVDKFEINIEAGSSSYDSIDSRREEAIAKYNMGLGAKQAGVNIDLDSLLIDVLDTFEGTVGTKYITKQPPQANPMMAALGGGMGGGKELAQPVQKPGTAEEVTQAVAGGALV